VEGPLALLEQLPAVTRARAEAELNRFFLAFDDSEVSSLLAPMSDCGHGANA